MCLCYSNIFLLSQPLVLRSQTTGHIRVSFFLLPETTPNFIAAFELFSQFFSELAFSAFFNLLALSSFADLSNIPLETIFRALNKAKQKVAPILKDAPFLFVLLQPFWIKIFSLNCFAFKTEV